MNLSYTLQGAVAATGLPYSTLIDAVRKGELAAIKSGRRYIVLTDDLLAYLKLQKERGVIPGVIDDEGRERLAELNRKRRVGA